MPSSRPSHSTTIPQPYPYHLADPTPRSLSTSTTSSSTHNNLTRIGRGGAGNTIRANIPAVAPPTTINPAKPSTPSKSKTTYITHTGRGGAGNFRRIPSEKRLFSFDEELALQLRRSVNPAPIYHIGRGGSGNTAATAGGAATVVLDGRERRESGASRATDSGSERSVSSSSVSASEGEGSEASAPRNIMRKLGRRIGGF